MIYEPVLVGSLEDALLATILNGKIEAVVIYRRHTGAVAARRAAAARFPHHPSRSRHVESCAARNRRDAGAAHQAHPPRARHLPADRPAGGKARGRSGGLDDPARVLRSRGVDGGAPQHPRRRRRPLFHAAFRQPQALRRAADRHVPRAADRARQVDHEVELDPRHGRVLRPEPVPRGNFGHHRRPRQHARADRHHQGRAGEVRARRRRGPRVLRHQRHLDVQQDGLPGGDRARRHRDRRPQLPQVAPLRHGAVGRAAALRRSFPDDRILDVRRGPAAHHQAGDARSQGRGTARSGEDGDAHQLHVRRPRLQHAPGDGRVPGDQAGSHLPVGRGVVRFCALVAVPASAHRRWARPPRSRNGGRPPPRWRRGQAQAAELGEDLDPKDARLLKRHLVPDPRKMRIRVYETDSVHKSMSALRQGSIVAVRDEDYNHHVSAFREAVFIHASTSPNAQIIASLDVARRQMELEGYELVMRAIEIAFAIRRDVDASTRSSRSTSACSAPTTWCRPSSARPGFSDFLDPGQHLGDGAQSGAGGRILPRSHAHDAGVRHRRIRRHLVQEPAGRRSTTSSSTRLRATACCCRATSTTRAATSRC